MMVSYAHIISTIFNVCYEMKNSFVTKKEKKNGVIQALSCIAITTSYSHLVMKWCLNYLPLKM
jgi:hypothetical protein